MTFLIRLQLILLVLVSTNIAWSQNSDVIELIDTIPFELTDHNNLSVQAVLNKVDTLDLMFHTAAHDLTVTTEAIEEKLRSIVFNRTDTVTSWGGDQTAKFSSDNTLQIGSLEWEDISIWETRHSGPGTDGKFDPDRFENKIIEIDFDRKEMLLHPSLPEKAKQFDEFKLIVENGFLFIEGGSDIGGKIYMNRFLIHSGYGGTILYDDQFTLDSQIGSQLSIIDEKELKDSYGNVITTKKAMLPRFNIGDILFEDIPVGFFEGSIGRQSMSVMGGDMLKRFNIIIDMEQESIYLKPNTLFSSPFGK